MGLSIPLKKGIEYDPQGLLKKQKEAIQYRLRAGLLPEKGWDTPIGIHMELTNHCNLQCVHCYNNSSAQCEGAELSTSDWLTVARQAAEMRVLHAVISGGEPLLQKELMFQVLDILRHTDMRFHLVSNGWSITQSLVTQLRKYKFSCVQISIDGSRPEIHDRVRGREGSWQRAIYAAKMLIDAGIPVAVAHVVTPASVDYIDEMCANSDALTALQKVLMVSQSWHSSSVIKNDGNPTSLISRW